MGLKRNHPKLFENAKRIEREAGNGYTWVNGKSLDDVVARAEERERTEGVIGRFSGTTGRRWQDVLRDEKQDDDPEDQACLICSL